MALLQVNFVSESLMRTVTMQVVLPVDRLPMPGQPKPEVQDFCFPTLYLLHGVLGNYTDWVSGTCVQRWAEEKGLAVVMPSGENMFYVDQPGANNYYGEFIGRELVEITRKMFPLSRRREDTFIGGLSMGGYGAIRNGLKYHETFGCIAALSAAAITGDIAKRTNDAPIFFETRDYAEAVFGDLTKMEGSDKDPYALLKKLGEEGAALPKIYMACGTEDSLLPANRRLRDAFRAAGADLTFEEDPGGHEWDFWNSHIKQVIDWLPLSGEADAGMNSGNVGI